MNPCVEARNMYLDARIEWPGDVPIGTFQIEPFNCADYPAATARILFVCPKGKRCGLLLGPVFVPRPTEDACNIWGWDGNLECPSITPSINCVVEKDGKPTGLCGWHGFIKSGTMK